MNPKQAEIVATKKSCKGVVVSNIKSSQFWSQFKDNPVESVFEIGIGAWKGGKVGLIEAGGRVAKAALAGNHRQQFASELSKLQAAGEIKTDDEITKHPYAIKSFVDLLEVIDNNPEEDRLLAIKAMFFMMISKDNDDKDDILLYQLFQITKELSSSQLMILKVGHDLEEVIRKEIQASKSQNPLMTIDQWYQKIADEIGHGLKDLVEKDARVLIDYNLIPKEITRSAIHANNFKLSKLGERLYGAIQDYQKMLSA